MRVTGKECINCKKVFFLPFGHEDLLEHDETHKPYTGYIELRKTKSYISTKKLNQSKDIN